MDKHERFIFGGLFVLIAVLFMASFELVDQRDKLRTENAELREIIEQGDAEMGHLCGVLLFQNKQLEKFRTGDTVYHCLFCGSEMVGLPDIEPEGKYLQQAKGGDGEW